MTEAVRNLNRSERRKIAHIPPLQKAATDYWKAFWADRRETISTKIAVDKLKPLIGFPRARDPVFKMTWLGWLNFIVLQWFFIRLIAGRTVYGLTYWKWIYFIVPLTGWWNNYKSFCECETLKGLR